MQNSLESIRWNALCPWLILVGSLRSAFRLRVLLLATTAVLVVLAGVVVAERIVAGPLWEPTTAALWINPNDASVGASFTTLGGRAAKGLLLPWQYFVVPVVALLGGPSGFGQFAAVFVLVLWHAAVWAAMGGAICRVAALGLTRSEAPDLPHALRFVQRNYGAFLSAPLMTLLGVLIAALPLVILGLVMRIEWLGFAAALLWPIVLLLGLGIGLLAIGLAIGFPLMWAAVAVEETDAFDAISRAFAYTYQRPLRLLWYVIVAALLGWLGGMAIELILTATRAMAEGAVAWGHGSEAVSSATNSIIRFWTGGLSVIRTAYYYGFFWSATVGVYLLLRRDIDSVPMDEVAIEELETYSPGTPVARGATAEASGATAEAQPASS